MSVGKKPRRYRWVCPECKVAVLAQMKPPKDSTVRYCLPCSSKSKKLVERTCPVLDKARKKKANAAWIKRYDDKKRKKVKEREYQAWEEGGHPTNRQLKSWVLKLWKLPSVKDKESTWNYFGGRHKVPDLVVVRRKSEPRTWGRAWPRGRRITIYAWDDMLKSEALEVLIHEVAHIVAGKDQNDSAHWHGDHHRAIMQGIIADLGLKPVNMAGTKYRVGPRITKRIQESRMIQEGW